MTINVMALLRPVRGCATDTQYTETYNNVATALETQRRRIDELEDFIRGHVTQCINIVGPKR